MTQFPVEITLTILNFDSPEKALALSPYKEATVRYEHGVAHNIKSFSLENTKKNFLFFRCIICTKKKLNDLFFFSALY